MIKWLFAIAETARLKTEVEELNQKLLDLQSRLDDEINSNRKREDWLVSLIAETSSQPRQARRAPSPQRLPLKQKASAENDDDGDEFGITLPEPEIPEALIRERAREFHAQALRNGVEYDLEVLVAHLKEHPEALSN